MKNKAQTQLIHHLNNCENAVNVLAENNMEVLSISIDNGKPVITTTAPRKRCTLTGHPIRIKGDALGRTKIMQAKLFNCHINWQAA